MLQPCHAVPSMQDRPTGRSPVWALPGIRVEAHRRTIMRTARFALAIVAFTAAFGVAPVAQAAPEPARNELHVVARVEGRTDVLLGPSVFGVTVQQDPLAYTAVESSDGTVRGHWTYHYYEAGVETTFAGSVTCLTVHTNRAWIGGTITKSSDPTQIGSGAWWQIADNGTGQHPVIPDRTTFAGIGTLTQTQAYCDTAPDPHFIFDVQRGGVAISDR